MLLPEIVQDFIIATATAGVTWFFSRQKQRADIKTAELDNVEKAIHIWRSIAEDLSKKVDELTDKCEALTQKFNETTHEIENLRRENKKLTSKLSSAIKTYENEKPN